MKRGQVWTLEGRGRLSESRTATKFILIGGNPICARVRRADRVWPRDLIVALAARHRLPVVYSFRSDVMSGGLMSYGPDTADLFVRSASYVDRILKGEKPNDMPVQAPTKFELTINLKTVKALGLNVPPSL